MEERAQINHIKSIFTNQVAQPVGAYSQGIIANGFLFLSGQIGLTQEGKLIGEDVASQSKQIFHNIDAMLADAKCSVKNIVKIIIYLKNIEDFKIVNYLYERWVSQPYPARTTIAASQLPLHALVEMECIARI